MSKDVSLMQQTARRMSGFLGRESTVVRTLRPAYEEFLDWSYQRRGIPWSINGEAYRIDPRQRHRLAENYDASVAEFLRERVPPGAVCFDVGANVGVYVLQFARWSGETGHVVAFEPNPSAVTVLRKHVAMNDLMEQVTIVPMAVGRSGGEAKFYACGADGMSRLGEANRLIADRAVEMRVPVITLDEFCAGEGLRPDWLFIDIEGFEIGALEGARNLIERSGAALNIVVEMHPSVWDSAGTTRSCAEDLLASLELRAVPLTGQTNPLGEYGIVWLERR
ncbi:MAG TPA: FkbM family methyltransferase [Pyrinomonadaceae bacterium]|nr:FkbM family methyltransferase [Pyrinomonadaceae bacterium]